MAPDNDNAGIRAWAETQRDKHAKWSEEQQDKDALMAAECHGYAEAMSDLLDWLTRGLTAARQCGHCGSTTGHCPECGTEYPHGSTSACTQPECIPKNAPVDCECGFIVESDLNGVLNFDLQLIPWSTE